MKFNVIFVISMLLILISTQVLAQEDVAEESAGVTPDSFLWGLDVALDKLALALTFDNEAKAEKGLEIAEERLLEIKVMATEKKIKAMAKAENEHGKVVVKVKESIENIEEDDPTEEVKTVIKLEKKIGEHQANLEDVKQKIDIKIRGELTEEQQSLIDSVLSNLEGQTGELKIKVVNKKDKTKIKIKVKTGKSEAEIEKEVEDIEDETGLTRDRTIWAQKAIEHTVEKIANAEEKINEKISEGENVTVALEFLEQAKDMLAQAKLKLNVEEYKEARKLAQDAGILAMHAKRGKSFEKIEVEEEEEEVACITHEECKIGEVCIEGECEKVKEEKLECVVDTDCKKDEICIEGECEELEEEAEEEEELECTVDADCKEGEICTDGKCEKVEEEKAPECVVDIDCEEGEVCTEGKCEKVEEPECTIDTDCKEDEACIEGTCEKIEE
ncbi:hypothetical protein JYT91_01125 [archaeon AH-315-M20]|nr:hypothetical protein [archaeon AH-315-M20]